MATIPPALHEYINTAFPRNVCLTGVVLDDGFAQISPRGSMQVFDDRTLAYWARGGGKSAEAVTDGTKITVYYRNPELGGRGGGNGMLPAGGIARFYGAAEIHKEGDAYEQVWNNMVQQERDNDADKGGYAVLIRSRKGAGPQRAGTCPPSWRPRANLPCRGRRTTGREYPNGWARRLAPPRSDIRWPALRRARP